MLHAWGYPLGCSLVVGGLGWAVGPDILGSIPTRSSPGLSNTRFWHVRLCICDLLLKGGSKGPSALVRFHIIWYLGFGPRLFNVDYLVWTESAGFWGWGENCGSVIRVVSEDPLWLVSLLGFLWLFYPYGFYFFY